MPNNLRGEYVYDINRILSKSNQQGNYQIESYLLQVDDLISNMKTVTPEFERFMQYTIELLYGLVDNEEGVEAY